MTKLSRNLSRNLSLNLLEVLQLGLNESCRSTSQLTKLHQQMFAGVVAAQCDVIDFANVHQTLAACIADGALNVFFHLAQRLCQRAFDWLHNALAFNVLVLAMLKSDALP